MLASLFAAIWFAVLAWYAITITVQAHVKTTNIPVIIFIVSLIALAASVAPIILLAV
jgi:hypothetical protein